jgi:hypothetical protein
MLQIPSEIRNTRRFSQYTVRLGQGQGASSPRRRLGAKQLEADRSTPPSDKEVKLYRHSFHASFVAGV